MRNAIITPHTENKCFIFKHISVAHSTSLFVNEKIVPYLKGCVFVVNMWPVMTWWIFSINNFNNDWLDIN